MNKVKSYNTAYRMAVLAKIEALPGQVFTRADITTDRSNGAQLRLNRALKVFIKQGHILKIAFGLYAKAKRVTLANGTTQTVLRASFESVAMEALNKLGLDWEFGTAIKEYNQGLTTQVPVKFTVKLNSRYRGIIGAEGRKVHFERNINAR